MHYLAWTVTLLASGTSATIWNMPLPSQGGDWKLVNYSHRFSCEVPNSKPVIVDPDWTIYGLHNTVAQQELNNCNNESFPPTRQLACTIVYAPPAGANVDPKITALKTQFTYERWGPNYWIDPQRVWALVRTISRYFATD